MFAEAKSTTGQNTVRLLQSEKVNQPVRQLVRLEERNLFLQYEVFVMPQVVQNQKIEVCNGKQT